MISDVPSDAVSEIRTHLVNPVLRSGPARLLRELATFGAQVWAGAMSVVDCRDDAEDCPSFAARKHAKSSMFAGGCRCLSLL